MMKIEDLFDFFQSGFYKEFWGWEFTQEESLDTAEKIMALLPASSGHILDWCGGWGRISLYLAKKGFAITILDFIEEYLKEAEQVFKEHYLTVTTIKTDCRKTPSHIQADHAICTFNTVGFLNDEEQIKAF